jgi:hypothetical protein
MKQLLFSFLIAGILLPVTHTVVAQQSAVNLLTGIAICTPGTAGNILAAESIHPKAKRLFEKEFKHAQHVQWLQLKDGQLAGFTENETRYSVYFNHNGSKAGCIKGYASTKLHQDILQLVEGDYPGYKITYVNEVNAALNGNLTVFVINIAGAKGDIKVVQVCEGVMEVTYDSNLPGTLVKRF